MAKEHYYFRLNPPRPTFPFDMTGEEGALMGRHAGYCADLTERGICILAGPVMDPRGTFGVGILEVDSRAEAEAICANDPSVLGGLNTVELWPMKVGFLRKGV